VGWRSASCNASSISTRRQVEATVLQIADAQCAAWPPTGSDVPRQPLRETRARPRTEEPPTWAQIQIQMGAAIADWPSAGRFRVALAEFFCEPQDVDGRSTSAIDDLRDYGYLSRSELQVIARSPELERAWAARLAGDSRTAQAEFEAASGSSREAVAAHAQAMLLMYSTACPGELIASCSQLAEHLCASPDAAVRTAGIRALIGAAEERGAGIEALCEAARRADDDPELGVTAAEAHLVIARWWCRRREKEQHKLPEAEAFAGKAIDEYSIVISRAVDTSEPALQIIVQLALNEKTKLLMERTYSKIVWLEAGRTAPTRANANRITGLPNSYHGAA
jgi:hypothetical protein